MGFVNTIAAVEIKASSYGSLLGFAEVTFPKKAFVSESARA